jgi:hypothetical protein
MRLATSLTALLLGATLLAPTGAATAVGETCRGEAATIVGTGASVQGTDGRDVIVTGTATWVGAAGGDDLICVTAPNGVDPKLLSLSLDAGAGNDLVDATASRATQISVVLGAGADEFLGGPNGDVVTGGAHDTSGGEVAPDNERDVIDSGDGVDHQQ